MVEMSFLDGRIICSTNFSWQVKPQFVKFDDGWMIRLFLGKLEIAFIS
jgi:hypothetical protein